MIGTLVLYGLAFVGLCAIVGTVGVAVFTWRLPTRTDPGVIDEQRHEYEHAQWRNNVRALPPNQAGNVRDAMGTPLPFTGPLFEVSWQGDSPVAVRRLDDQPDAS
jgi:hypothetical protein